ncbi:MAG: DUF1232 domain-containing protein [Calditrichaeota bacterium]|nr:MAG: DUF1232 domain-containing protein [Calditrichota bacterium]
MAEKEAGYYQKLRNKIILWLDGPQGNKSPWSKYILWAPDLFYLLWKLSLDPQVPASERLKVLGAVAYFISPIDIIPEMFLGPLAFADDIVLASFLLDGLINKTPVEVVKKYWLGDSDVLEVIQKIIGISRKMVGNKVWEALRKKTR